MAKISQRELIRRMSTREITKHLIVTQLILLTIAVLSSAFLFVDPVNKWLSLFNAGPEILWFGVMPAIIVISIDFILMFLLPERFYDDGGINQKVFQNQKAVNIFWLTLLIAICEEVLFRGVIQTSFGYLAAGTLFALIHFRYLKKVVLFVSVLLVSYFLGYMFHITENLLVTITSHFLIDFILGIWISKYYGRGQNE
ncbi:CPBP family intramembrane glutamic endopeptidase [Halobacillus sp. A5]|uniref:CPBP family intramembrane glutamic endopeptidase n=1 Tax=Halobacillus sp. A5 TaxID=2880263 RepID=UPI0020A68DE1|nr:CPBP family intramembrane glutamic endopeptidase [Halobacillus sp. A5]MCP3025825.1 CPBP family intramembrane metalloprotease [Halobacillus sp. A5]